MRAGRPSAATLLTGAFVVLGLLWAGFLGLRQLAGDGSVLDRFEYLTADLRFALLEPRPPPGDVVIVAIDDATLRDLGAYPLPRGVLARIVNALAACRPQALAIDIAFLDAGPPDADAALAEAVGATPSVIAAIGQFGRDDPRDAPDQSAPLAFVPRPARILWATAPLRAAARSGLVNVVTDLSGIPRYIPMLFRVGDGVEPSFALAAAAAAFQTEPVFGPDAVTLGSTRVAMDLGYHLPIRYYGPAGSIRQISAARVLRGAFDQADVRAKIVVLGVTASGVGDTFATPFDRIVPGVEVFATGIGNLLAGDGLIRTATVRRIDAAAALLLASVTVLLMSMRRAFLGLGLAGLFLACWGALTLAAFAEGIWLSVAVPFAAVAPVAVAYGAARLGVDRYAAGRLAADKATLIRFQSPLLAAHILGNPRFLDRPVRQDLAIVFLDLSGFTGVTEALGPERTRDMLAEFQALVEREVAADDGYVVSFMGDGAMIAFGLPAPRPDDAARALRAVMRLHACLTAWIAGLPTLAKDRLSIRIGGHFGPAVASRLGPAHHQHIAATGDTVNVASRLLEVGKQQKCSVIVSDDLFAAADPPVPAAASLEVAIRGRAQTLRIRIMA